MIGSRMALAFLEAGKKQGLNLEVYGMARDMGRAVPLFEGLSLKALSCDVAADLGDLPRFDYIVHAASPVGPAYFADRQFDVVSANLAGTVNLLNKAIHDKTRGFLFVSTHEVYGGGREVWREEDAGAVDFTSSRACYPESKRAAENACVSARAQHGLRTVSARLSRVYGPDMNLDNGLFVCDFFKDALVGRPVEIRGDGNLLRPLCYVADVIEAMTLLLFRGDAGQAYNVAPEEKPSIAEVARGIAGLAGVGVAAARSGPGGGAVQNTDRLQALGWRARTSLAEGLENTWTVLSKG